MIGFGLYQSCVNRRSIGRVSTGGIGGEWVGVWIMVWRSGVMSV